MQTPTNPVEAVRHPDPYPYYARLTAERPFGWDERLQAWVAADAASVTAALSAAELRVRPPGEPVPTGLLGTAAGAVFGDLVRMTDGPDQQRLQAGGAWTRSARPSRPRRASWPPSGPGRAWSGPAAPASRS